MHTELKSQNVEERDDLACIDAIEDIIEMELHNGGYEYEQYLLS
jgi:hypothetical protein